MLITNPNPKLLKIESQDKLHKIEITETIDGFEVKNGGQSSGGSSEGFTGYKGVEFTSPRQEFEVDTDNLEQYPSFTVGSLTFYKVSGVPFYNYQSIVSNLGDNFQAKISAFNEGIEEAILLNKPIAYDISDNGDSFLISFIQDCHFNGWAISKGIYFIEYAEEE